MDKILLRFVGLFNPVFEKAGVNTVQLHEILRIKLLMDNRRPKVAFSNRRAANNKTTKSSFWGNFVLLMMGTLMGGLMFLFRMPMAGQTVYFTMFIVLMALTMISDFTSVLIDTRDQYIINPRPVDDRTFAISRLMHITLYVSRLALLQGLPGTIMMYFIDGWLAVPLFFVQVVEATLLAVLIVNMVYFILMRSVSPQRFKDMISYFQIGFSVLIFAVYYLLPRLIKVSVLRGINLLAYKWVYFMPSIWVAALNEGILHRDRADLLIYIIAVIGVVTPIIGFWFVAKVLAPGFNKKLTLLATSDGNSNSAENASRTVKSGFGDTVANLLAPDPVENAGFKITWKLTSRTREFKIKVFPAFAYVPIYFLYFALNGAGDNLNEKMANLQAKSSYIFLIYMTTFVLSTILQNVSQSSKYKSAWVYYALPIDKPGKILSGMYKAIVAFYFLPYCLVIGLVIVLVWGTAAVNDIILAFFISTIYGMLMALFMVKGLPFSRPVVVKGGSRIITSLLILGFVAILGLGHYFLIKWEKVIWISILPVLLINWLMFNQYKKQGWDSI